MLGGLPGETAEVRITTNKRKYAHGLISNILEASEYRNEPKESHYLSCSPWQGVDYPHQLELKRGMLAELFGRPELALEVEAMIGAKSAFGYRNKLEFTVETDPYGELRLAFHARGSFRDLVPADHGCVLGSAAMNTAAKLILERLRELDMADYADTITVRESQTHGGVIAIVHVKVPVERDWSRLVSDTIKGVAVVHKRAHLLTDILWSHGELELAESLGGVTIHYPWDSFFQVNVPMFERALERILAEITPGARVADLYGGAGTIGLPVARMAASVTGIEIAKSSVELANRNAALNRLSNYEAIAIASEHMDGSLLLDVDTVIVDPPRAGLHAKVIEMLLEALPAKIIYLSCNPATQARDVMLLKAGGYRVGRLTGFDFYPGTLHLESLVVLTLA